MKLYIIPLLLLVANTSFAQSEYPYADTKAGYLHINEYDKFRKGDTITFGPGTMPSQDFQYVNITVAKIPLSSYYAGKRAVIKGFNYQGSSKLGFKFYVILGGDKFDNYEVDMKNAIASGEVVSKAPEKANVIAKRPIAQEINALKNLLDKGVISQEEFEKGKKKILE